MTIQNNFPAIKPSLNLDFANTKVLDSRITFARNSQASYYGADGILRLAQPNVPRFDHNPATGESLGLLIESSGTNLLTYSEDFTHSSWTKNGLSVHANMAIAPDGTLTASKLVESTNSGGHTIFRSVTATNSTAYSFSVYLKAAERTSAMIHLYTNSLSDGATIYVNLNTYTVSSVSTFGVFTNTLASITNVGNGWCRVALSGTTKSSGVTGIVAQISIMHPYSVTSYAGDGVSGIFVWGSQLEQNSFPTSYIPSNVSFTSRASTASFVGSNGFIQYAAVNQARMTYNPTNLALAPKLLLEPERTNLLTYSEQLDNAVWDKVNATVTANAVVSPDGTTTADTLVENTNNSNHAVARNVPFNNGVYTVSTYVKAAGRNFVRLFIYDGTNSFSAYFNIVNGTVGAITRPETIANILHVGNGWYRISVAAPTTAGVGNVTLRIASANGTDSYAGNDSSGVHIWGFQLEESNYPTSYIPTTASTVTRSADISSSSTAARVAENATMMGANFSSWYNPNESTVVVKWHAPINSSDVNNMFSIVKFGAIEVVAARIGNNLGRRMRVFGQTITGAYEYTIEGQFLPTETSGAVSLAYRPSNDFAVSSNGTDVVVDTVGSIDSYAHNALVIGALGNTWFNGHISKLVYYPKRIANNQLQALSA